MIGHPLQSTEVKHIAGLMCPVLLIHRAAELHVSPSRKTELSQMSSFMAQRA